MCVWEVPKTLEAFIAAVVYQFIVMLIQKMRTVNELVDTAVEGIKSVMSAMLILAMAYCLNFHQQHTWNCRLCNFYYRKLDDTDDPYDIDLLLYLLLLHSLQELHGEPMRLLHQSVYRWL